MERRWTIVAVAAALITPMSLKDGCDDPTNFDCLDFTVPWPWWATVQGTIDM